MLPVAPAPCSLCRFPHTQPFSNLARAALADFNSICSTSTYPAAELLLREQHRADRVVALYEGHVKLSCTSRDGRSMTWRIAGPGQILGISAALSDDTYEVSALATEDVLVKIIRRAKFIEFLERYPAAALHIAKTLAMDYKLALEDVRRLGLSTSVPARLASLLLDWRGSPGLDQTENRFQLIHTHDEIAAFAATSRESVTRTLTKFRQDKYIHIDGAWVEVLAPEKLAALAV